MNLHSKYYRGLIEAAYQYKKVNKKFDKTYIFFVLKLRKEIKLPKSLSLCFTKLISFFYLRVGPILRKSTSV